MKPLDGRAGFSLVELLVASAIFFSFMVGMSTLYSQSHRSYTRGQNRIEVQQSARVAAESMAREIRMTGYDPSGAIPSLTNPSAVQLATADGLTVIADITGDDVTDRITFRLQDGQILREFSSWTGSDFSVVEVGELAHGVTTLGFTYFDGSDPVNLSIPAPVDPGNMPSIRRILADVVATTGTGTNRESFPLSMDVNLRNLR